MRAARTANEAPGDENGTAFDEHRGTYNRR